MYFFCCGVLIQFSCTMVLFLFSAWTDFQTVFHFPTNFSSTDVVIINSNNNKLVDDVICLHYDVIRSCDVISHVTIWIPFGIFLYAPNTKPLTISLSFRDIYPQRCGHTCLNTYRIYVNWQQGVLNTWLFRQSYPELIIWTDISLTIILTV